MTGLSKPSRPSALRTLALACVLVGGATGHAWAWDAATTHRGLTERALAVSQLHSTLAQQLGRPLGSFEPLRLDVGTLGADLARDLKGRLDRIDPASGARPSPEGVASASAWVLAGAVLEKTPPERGRHHFFEPSTRTGLDDGPGLSGELHVARLTAEDGATVRDAATGLAFDLTGMPALDWLRSPRNDLGLTMFFEQWAEAVAATSAGARETALVRALLALGATVAVLEDMGQPAFVRNDFRGEFLQRETGSELEQLVADRYGAVALPTAEPPVARPDVDSFFVAADGKGLAQLTQARFFSPGTLPRDFTFDARDQPSELLAAVNQTLRFPAPALTAPLALAQPGRTRYVEQDGLRVLAYARNGKKVHFFLDRAVYAGFARQWLPKVGAYAAGLLNHLLRARLTVSVEQGQATIGTTGIAGALAAEATLHVLAEDGAGVRKELGQAPLRPETPATFAVPAGTRKVAAYARGRDSGGDFVAVGETTLP